jgi:glycerophosphoryl diester phosphodiesterase
MMEDSAALLRELLDDDSSSTFLPMIRHDSEAHHDKSVEARCEELKWLKRLVASIPGQDLLPRLVAHRGFHHIKDRNDKRPLENSLSAYEMAWTSGIHLCECDIAMTKDERLVLAHDDNFMRLALDSNSLNSKKKISDLTLRELIAMPLISGVRPPLLIDVLRSACAISEHSRLVIEIKPGNQAAASALARLLLRHPNLRKAVAMIMSFDAVTMHRLRAALNIVDAASEAALAPSASQVGMHHRINSFDHFGTMHGMLGSHHRKLNSMDQMSSIGLSLSETNLDSGVLQQAPVARKFGTMPKLMLLTVADPPKRPCELRVGVDDFSHVDNWLNARDGSLDGVYLQFEQKMMTPEGVASLRRLSERYFVGIWTHSGKDPDDFHTFQWLVKEGNCTFVNSDLPNHFRKEILVRATTT